MLFNILKIKLIFGDFVIQCWLSMSFDAGLSIARNWFWVHIWRRFDILKCCAALMHGFAWCNHRLYYTYMHNITCDIMHWHMIRFSLYCTGTTNWIVCVLLCDWSAMTEQIYLTKYTPKDDFIYWILLAHIIPRGTSLNSSTY